MKSETKRDVNNFDTIRGKRVLLYSGGLDSYIASHLWQPDVNLYVDTRSKYSAKEIKFLPAPPHGELVVDRRLDLSDMERVDEIVPHRNALLVMVAAYYGTTIALGATAGDRSTDKDSGFAEKATALLNHIYTPQHWCPSGAIYSVVLPVKNNSKSDLVRGFLKRGGTASQVAALCSCYHPVHKQCGACKACARKWVAEVLNGVDNFEYETPAHMYFTDEMLGKAVAAGYRGEKEDADLVEAMTMIGRLH